MSRLPGERLVNAIDLRLEPEPLPAEEVVSGEPAAAWHPCLEYNGSTIGVWEMTPGVAQDTEADEVFIVVSGRATIDFVDSATAPLALAAGDVVRLRAGARTVWTVTETLRKIAIC